MLELRFCTETGFLNFLTNSNILFFDGVFGHRNSLLKFACTTVYCTNFSKIGFHTKYFLHDRPGHVGEDQNSNFSCTESTLYPEKTRAGIKFMNFRQKSMGSIFFVGGSPCKFFSTICFPSRKH